jgi:accessory colonization factor AcfC
VYAITHWDRINTYVKSWEKMADKKPNLESMVKFKAEILECYRAKDGSAQKEYTPGASLKYRI